MHLKLSRAYAQEMLIQSCQGALSEATNIPHHGTNSKMAALLLNFKQLTPYSIASSLNSRQVATLLI